MLTRTFDADHLNRVVNHPSVISGTLSSGALDLSEAIKNPANVCLMDDTGGFFCDAKGDGIYEVHTQFLPEGRGAHAQRCAYEGAFFMFTQTDCVALRTFCADGNRAAINLTLRMKFIPIGRTTVLGQEGTVYSLSIKRWAMELLCQPQQ